MVIFTLTGISKDLKRVRCYGYMGSFEEAEKELMENKQGFTECLYHYFVIEAFKDGFYAFSDNNEVWYEHNETTNKITRIDKPKETDGIVNWGMG